jgi:hypothetical protein
MGRFTRTAVAIGFACLVVLGGSAAAGGPGGPEEPNGLMVAANANGVVSAVIQDKVCEEARGKSGERGPCASEVVGGATAATFATAEQVTADGNLVSADGIKLSTYLESIRAGKGPTTTPTGTIWTRTWWQEARGLYYINWWEKHTGRIYWHTGHVWSTAGAHGYTGRHTCDQGGGIGYDVRVTACFTERLTTNHINEWDYWKVYVFFQGFPISASHDMRASAWGSGNIYFYW